MLLAEDGAGLTLDFTQRKKRRVVPSANGFIGTNLSQWIIDDPKRYKRYVVDEQSPTLN